MPRVNVPVTVVGSTLVTKPAETNGDATNNHEVANNGATWLEVRNADTGGTHNMTVKIQTLVDGQAVTSRQYAIPASSTRIVRLGSVKHYGSLAQVDVDSAQLRLLAFTLG